MPRSEVNLASVSIKDLRSGANEVALAVVVSFDPDRRGASLQQIEYEVAAQGRKLLALADRLNYERTGNQDANTASQLHLRKAEDFESAARLMGAIHG